jgi:predicted PurR-regulated permease PerM
MALSICLGLILAALAAWFFYYLTWFILLIYLSFIVATILDAPVHWMIRRGLRRGLAAVIIMVGGLAFTGTGLYLLGSSIYTQVEAVSSNLTHAPKRINEFMNGLRTKFMPRSDPAPPAAATEPAVAGTQPGPLTRPIATAPADGDFNVEQWAQNAIPGVSAVWTNAFRGIEALSWLVIMFFIVLYMLVDGADHLKAARTVLPKHMRLEATKLFNEIAQAHRGWAVASFANIMSSAILTSLGLWLLGVPGALILGFIAGLGEIVPNIGPIAGAVPALLLTLVAEPDKFLYVVGMFVIVQTVQSYTISPMMLKISIEMPVLVTIISVLIFGTLFGLLGVLVAIPFVADAVVIWNYVAKWREKDTLDYDVINAPAADGARAPASPDNTHPSRLRKLFVREKKKAFAQAPLAQAPNQNSPTPTPTPAPTAEPKGLDRLAEAEAKTNPKHTT